MEKGYAAHVRFAVDTKSEYKDALDDAFENEPMFKSGSGSNFG